MDNLDKKAIWPGWETVRLVRSDGRESIYEIAREREGRPERATLTWISIPMPRRDPWNSSARQDAAAGRIGPFPQEMRDSVRELARVREMNGHPAVLDCLQTLLVQKDDGNGWDALILTEPLPPITSLPAGTLTEEQILRLGVAVCQALQAGEQRELNHRMVCPGNIYQTAQGGFKLGGFGVAGLLEKNGGLAGQPEFMAPELSRGEPCGRGGDVCSLGLVLYWLMNDRRSPFLPLPPAPWGEAEREEAVQRRFRGEPLPPPAHGSERLKRVVMKACAFDPAERYADAGEMQRDLQRLIDGGVQAAAAGAKQPPAAAARRQAGAPQAALQQRGEAAAAGSKNPRRNLSLLIGLPVAVLALILTIALKHGRNENKEPAVTPAPAESSAPATPEPTVEPTVEPTIEPTPTSSPVEQGGTGPRSAETPEPSPAAGSTPELATEPALMPTQDSETGAAAEEPAADGEEGKPAAQQPAKADWKLEKGILTISGSGELTWDTEEDIPWNGERDQIEQVVIEEGVLSIGKDAFRDCVNLKSAKLPGTLTRIPPYAFSGCIELEEIRLPSGVVSIGRSAFSFCGKLNAVYFPAGLEEIGDYAFQGCSGLRDIFISSEPKIPWEDIEKGIGNDILNTAVVHPIQF